MGYELILDFGDNQSARTAFLAHLVAQQASAETLAAFPMPKGVLTNGGVAFRFYEETLKASYIVKK